MNSYGLDYSKWLQFHQFILQSEKEGLVTRTFRRLDLHRQEAIVNAILEEAAERGPSALNIKLVAQRAGVSVGSLYQYFKDRERMLDFAVELCVRYTIDLFDEYRTFLVSMPLREALSAYLIGGVEWGQTQAGFLQLFARAAYQGEQKLADRLVIPIASYLRELIKELLTIAKVHGEIRSDIDLEAVSRIIHALTIVVGDSQLLPYLNDYFQVIDPSLDTVRTMQSLIDLILTGIAIPASSEA